MEKTFLYRWTHKPTGKTGTSEAFFASEKVFLACLESWNRWTDWHYVPATEKDATAHDIEKGIIFAGPFHIVKV